MHPRVSHSGTLSHALRKKNFSYKKLLIYDIPLKWSLKGECNCNYMTVSMCSVIPLKVCFVFHTACILFPHIKGGMSEPPYHPVGWERHQYVRSYRHLHVCHFLLLYTGKRNYHHKLPKGITLNYRHSIGTKCVFEYGIHVSVFSPFKNCMGINGELTPLLYFSWLPRAVLAHLLLPTAQLA